MLVPRAALIALLVPSALVAAPDGEAFFEKSVRPILVAKCYSCHGSDKRKGNLRLDSRAAILTGGERGPAVVPGKAKESLLVAALGHDAELKMPPKDKLPPAEIAALAEWVRLGAPWPNATAPVVPIAKVVDRPFTAEEKAFWAFQTVRRPEVPNVQNVDWCRNPIDRFLLAKLEAAGRTPAPESDRRSLIRRLSFDLTGLGPTAAEVEAFLADEAPDAYANLVDRLLASSAHGEKWGRRWLDVARFADSNGMDENLAHANAWRYRDYVIRSFNRDLPYDRFVREQLAGDLLSYDSLAERGDALTATGFLVIGPKMLAEDDPIKMRMDIVDEQLDTMGQVFVGLTLGCARCHDHKFDPITAADYYGLAGLFYSTKAMQNYSVVARWHERPIGTPEVAAALAAHDKMIAAARKVRDEAEEKLSYAAERKVWVERFRTRDYVSAGLEAQRRSGPLKLAVADPVKNLPPGGIRVEAEAFDRGNVLKLTTGYGVGIGVILNAGPMPNFSEYDLNIPKAGAFQLAIRFAAQDARPIRVQIDGKIIRTDAANFATGSWNPDGQRWSPEAMLELSAGKHVVRFDRDGAFPHIDQFALIPVTAEQVAAAPLSIEKLAKDRKLFATLLKPWADAIAKLKGASPSSDDIANLLRAPDGPFHVSSEVEAEVEPARHAELTKLKSALAALEKARPKADEAMAVEDLKGENLRIHLRGNHLTLGPEVARRFPRILTNEVSLNLGTNRSGRREFADWLTRADNPLTARVMVNRIWAGHFGSGLVRSPDNFGRLGERPTHPELLDWLADEFVRSGWSMKHLHRLVVNSAAYRISSRPELTIADPENRLLGRFNRRRLDAEEVRDALLDTTGLLDRTAGGTMLTVGNRQYVTDTGNTNYKGYASHRRSVYLPVIRSAVYDVLQTLDFPDPSVPSGLRSTTTIPTQALLLMNSPLADQSADAFATTLMASPGSDADRIRAAYRQALNRAPLASELNRVQRFLVESSNAKAAWRGLCRVLLASNEFVFVE